MIVSKHICIDIHLCEPQFGTVVPHMAFIIRIRLREIVSLNFSVLCELFLELRKFWQPLDNFDKKKLTLFG